MERAVSSGRLRLLVAEIRRDVGVLDRVSSLVREGVDALRRQPDSRPCCAVLAVDLHRWCTAFESTLERIERFFDLAPAGAEWHGGLLSGALLDVPDVRPPIVSPPMESGLRELLRFRHFFRHAYVVELDPAKLAVVADHHATVADGVARDLDRFAGTLEAMADRLGQRGGETTH